MCGLTAVTLILCSLILLFIAVMPGWLDLLSRLLLALVAVITVSMGLVMWEMIVRNPSAQEMAIERESLKTLRLPPVSVLPWQNEETFLAESKPRDIPGVTGFSFLSVERQRDRATFHAYVFGVRTIKKGSKIGLTKVVYSKANEFQSGFLIVK